jgi:hypothetical protein
MSAIPCSLYLISRAACFFRRSRLLWPRAAGVSEGAPQMNSKHSKTRLSTQLLSQRREKHSNASTESISTSGDGVATRKIGICCESTPFVENCARGASGASVTSDVVWARFVGKADPITRLGHSECIVHQKRGDLGRRDVGGDCKCCAHGPHNDPGPCFPRRRWCGI